MTPTADYYFSPLRYVVDTLYHADAPYSRAARSIGVAIAARLNSKPKNGRYQAQMGQVDLQKRSKYGEDQTDVAVKELCEGKYPVFEKVPGRLMKSMRREPNTYVLIVHDDTKPKRKPTLDEQVEQVAASAIPVESPTLSPEPPLDCYDDDYDEDDNPF